MCSEGIADAGKRAACERCPFSLGRMGSSLDSRKTRAGDQGTNEFIKQTHFKSAAYEQDHKIEKSTKEIKNNSLKTKENSFNFSL